jgi:hypothetical protein
VSSSGTKARSNTSGAEASANARGSKPSQRDASDADSSGAESSEADTISPEHARLNLWLSAGVQFALLPSAAFTAGLGLELEARRYSIGLRALLWPSVTKKLSTADGDVQAHFAAFGAAFRGCALFPLDSLTFATCAALQAAAVRGDTDSTARVRADSAIAPWYSLAIAAGLDWPRAAPLRLRLEASLSVSLDRPRFDVEGSSSAYRVPQWSPLLAAGLVFTP